MADVTTAANVHWTDQDGCQCNVAVRLTDARLPAEFVDTDVIGVVETCSQGGEGWLAVYLPREQAQALHDLLGRALTKTHEGESGK